MNEFLRNYRLQQIRDMFNRASPVRIYSREAYNEAYNSINAALSFISKRLRALHFSGNEYRGSVTQLLFCCTHCQQSMLFEFNASAVTRNLLDFAPYHRRSFRVFILFSRTKGKRIGWSVYWNEIRVRNTTGRCQMKLNRVI